VGQSGVLVTQDRGIRMSNALYLRSEAARCFRLARGPASLRLADELEALGRTFEREAREVEARLPHRAAQRRYERKPTLRRGGSDC
jgi:hypothetical protein